MFFFYVAWTQIVGAFIKGVPRGNVNAAGSVVVSCLHYFLMSQGLLYFKAFNAAASIDLN